ncbi:XdhC family protein [Luteibacter sp.]|uniref:XdhC family protein n=1 Tax=Luteibacter sp. TaxID=1886636 RepID=UPI003F7E5B64
MKSYGELRELATAWRALGESSSGRAALVTILRTSGSTFRRVGAAMFVRDDGSVINPLAGGCPQRELVERSLDVMREDRIAYVAYNAEQGLDLLLEAGCGGELEVAIEPLRHGVPGFLPELEAMLASSRAFHMITHFPGPDAPGHATRSLALVDVADAPVARDGATSAETAGGFRLVETFDAPVSLVVAGASHEALELVSAAAHLGWRGVLVDTSAERLAAMPVAAAGWEAIAVPPARLAAVVRMHASTAVVSMTHNLEQDVAYLRAGLACDAFYLGALGSQQRARTIARAVASKALRVPAGLDIGSNTSREIALSIVAEIMAARHARDGRALSRSGGPIH